MNEKWKRFARSALTLLMVAVMVVGNVRVVEAAALQAPKIEAGTGVEVCNTLDCSSESFGSNYLVSSRVLFLSEGSEVFLIPYYAVSIYGYGELGALLLSESPFSGSHLGSYKMIDVIDYDTVLESAPSVDFSSSSLTYNGHTYYYYKASGSYGPFESPLVIADSNLPYVNVNDYIDGEFYGDTAHGQFFEKFYFADLIWQGGSVSSAPDFSSGALDTLLGSLSGLKADTYVQKSDSVLVTPMTLGVDEAIREKFTAIDYERSLTWSNVHKEWDDSYQVALYRKMFVRKKSLLTIGDLFSYGDIVAESELCFVDSVPYASCNASYVATKAVNDEFQTLFDKYSLIGHEFFYHDYLIIYHESDDGVVYGYWNVIPSFGEEVTYGILNSKGQYDSVGKIDGGDIESDVYLGDSIESSKDDKPYFDDGLSDAENDHDQAPSLDSITGMFNYFIGTMNGLLSSVGRVPSIVAEAFGFFPPEVIGFLSLGLVLMIILRIVGR